MHRVLAGLFALTLLACGFDDDDDAADAVDVTTSAEDAGSDVDSDYCTAAGELQGSDDIGLAFGFAPDGSAASAADVEAGAARLQATLDDLAAAAPDELREDVDLLVEVFDGFLDAVEEADFDVTALDPADPRVARMTAASAEDGSDPELDAAGARIEAYNAEACGLTTAG